MVTTGGIHGVYIVCRALLEPGDEVIVPDPEWPPCMGNIRAAEGRAGPLSPPRARSAGATISTSSSRGSRRRTRAIYINSPHNPTGGVLTRADIEAIAALAQSKSLWLISDEAYEDVIFDRAEHVSPASLPGMYERTISIFTFSKTYAMTGLRLGYVAAQDATLRERMKKMLFYSAATSRRWCSSARSARSRDRRTQSSRSARS